MRAAAQRRASPELTPGSKLNPNVPAGSAARGRSGWQRQPGKAKRPRRVTEPDPFPLCSPACLRPRKAEGPFHAGSNQSGKCSLLPVTYLWDRPGARGQDHAQTSRSHHLRAQSKNVPTARCDLLLPQCPAVTEGPGHGTGPRSRARFPRLQQGLGTSWLVPAAFKTLPAGHVRHPSGAGRTNAQRPAGASLPGHS